MGQQFVNVYKGVGSVNVNQCQQGGWLGQKRPKICKHSLWMTPNPKIWYFKWDKYSDLFYFTHNEQTMNIQSQTWITCIPFVPSSLEWRDKWYHWNLNATTCLLSSNLMEKCYMVKNNIFQLHMELFSSKNTDLVLFTPLN